ncbi:MAG: hypothetical protein JO316_00345 [Abitibacteriaceae bacterium]|nr:hypothetical protein [Abditibacteriaceae bacterium]
MKRKVSTIGFIAGVAAVSLWIAARGVAQNGTLRSNVAAATRDRPLYRINATLDYDILSLKSSAQVTVPIAPGDALHDVVFFLFANAGGVGGDDARRKNLVVDSVSLNEARVPFSLNGAVLRVNLPQPMREAFTLNINYHGIVPRSPAGSGSIMDMMGGMGSDLGDLGGLLGGGETAALETQKPKPQNIDYGLYTYGNGMLSLGSFWYPTLAVRQNGRWVDEAPEGLGDVAYADMSDYDVALRVPPNVTVAATGQRVDDRTAYHVHAEDVRDCSVLMSEDYVTRARTFDVAGKPVIVTAYTLKTDTAKADKAIDIAGHALQIYSRRFGPYPYDDFKVVEGPIRGGAGGMEFSGLTSIASMLYGDMAKQLNDLSGALGAGDLNKIMGGLGDDGGDGTDAGAPPTSPAAPAAQPQRTAATRGGNGAETEPELPNNPASDLLKSLLGQQKNIFDSMFEATIAHEVAHQWWAIGVGSDSQRAPFVDESLANYSSMLYFEDRYGPEVAQKMMDLHLRTTYSMGRMMGGGDAPANLRTSAYKNNIQYGAVVYGKGALYYDALRHAVGDGVFFASLQEYYARYRDRLAGPRSLLTIIERRAPNAHVDALYHRWIEETHGDDDITGGKAMDINDLLGGILGGGAGGLLGGGDE